MLNKIEISALLLSFSGILFFTFSACEIDPVKPLKPIEEVVYTYNHSTTTLTWTAYKYTNRVSVNGTFDEFMIHNTTKTNSISDLVKDLTFSINPHSVNTNLLSRDVNIADYFFKKFNVDGDITGSVTNCSGLKKAGDITIDLNMNGVNYPAYLKYTFSETDYKLIIEGDININNWNGKNALSALNEQCAGFHTAEDGQSKLWPDIIIRIETTLIVD